MHLLGLIIICTMYGLVLVLAWRKRFHIRCWWAAQKMADKAYPEEKDIRRRVQFSREYMRHLMETRHQIRAERCVR